MKKTFVIIVFLFISKAILAQNSSGPENGKLILTGGALVPEALVRFVELAGGENAKIVYIPTAASQLKLPSEYIYNPDSVDKEKEFAMELSRLFRVKNVTVLHTRDRKVADSKEFSDILTTADGVWIGAGNSGRITEAYLGTKTEAAMKELLRRGKVIGGHSAGTIIQGSFIVRGRYDKPLLMPSGRTTGFGFMKNVVVNPHVISAKRENELIEVLDAHPELLGIGMDDDSAIEVERNVLKVIGSGKVAIYENIKRDNSWYYWLSTGDQFDIKSRSKRP